MKIIKAPEEIAELQKDFVSYFQARSLSIILGAGFSVKSQAKNGFVPDAKTMKAFMVSELRKSEEIPDGEDLDSYSFKELCALFEDDNYVGNSVRTKYYADNFSEVRLAEQRKKILDIDWSYVYTFNIDDAIENNSQFNHPVVSNNIINDEVYKNYKCVIKLHGDINDIVTNKERRSKVFTDDEYLHSIKTNKSLLDKLENDYRYQNILFFGCSLDDEFDLQTLQIPLSGVDDRKARRILFSAQEPSFKSINILKNSYRITDIVILPDYDKWYSMLYDAWEESKKIPANLLGNFENVPKQNLGLEKKNESYFYYGKSLFDIKHKRIVYPYYFIHREMTNLIIDLLLKSNVVLIQGRSVSGRSYLLADINCQLAGRTIYYFGGFSRLNDEAVDMIIKKKNIVSLFDINTINRQQLERILENADLIHGNGSSVVAMLSYNDSDSMGIVKFKLKNKELSSDNIVVKRLPYKYSEDELASLNPKLTSLDIPVFSRADTILGNIINAEQKALKNGKYSSVRLQIQSFLEVVFYIVLATNEKVYTSDIVRFDIARETFEAVSKYPQFMEEIVTDLLEKDSADTSSRKYVLNAELWLRNQLRDFAEDRENYNIVIEAYYHIVSKIVEAERQQKRRTERYRKYIYFDSINNIFVRKSKNNLHLIIGIYEKLNPLLSQDYNFVHQFAKGYLNMGQYAEVQDKKYINFESAYKKINVAESLVRDAIDRTARKLGRKSEDYKQITLSHMLFTKALILSGLCLAENMTGKENIEKALSAIKEALLDRDNFESNIDSENDNLIQEFINECSNDEAIKAENKKIMGEILTEMLKFSGHIKTEYA